MVVESRRGSDAFCNFLSSVRLAISRSMTRLVKAPMAEK